MFLALIRQELSHSESDTGRDDSLDPVHKRTVIGHNIETLSDNVNM